MKPPRQSIGAAIVSLTLLAAACGGESPLPSMASPTAPTPVTSVPTGPTVTLTGVVIEAGGSGLSASVSASPLRFTTPWAGPGRFIRTDAAGQYRLTALPAHADTVYVRATRNGYVQQCAAAVTLENDASVNLTLASYASARTTGLPTSPDLRHVSGVVYETTAGGRRPVADVWVGWEPIMDTVVADTRTDAQGRYRLCGLPQSRIDSLFAVRAGSNRPVYASVEAGGDAVIDLDLP